MVVGALLVARNDFCVPVPISVREATLGASYLAIVCRDPHRVIRRTHPVRIAT